MARKYESTRHIEDTTQAEVSAAIRYLDPDLRRAHKQQSYYTGVIACVILAIFVLSALFLLFCKV
jgi:hypothetical protein